MNLEFIEREVMKYTGCYVKDRILYGYNRMTVEELVQEVALRLLRAPVEEMNKSYIRTAIMFTCIDAYRKAVEDDSDDLQELEDPREDKELVERLKTLEIFSHKELKVILMLMEGYRNPDIQQALGIPKRSYYTLLNRIKKNFTDLEGTFKDLY